MLSKYPEEVLTMREKFLEFLASAKHSYSSKEYGTDFKPIEDWHALGELSRKSKKKENK